MYKILRHFLITTLSTVCFYALAQPNIQLLGGRNLGLANTSAANGSVWSALGNPAGLGLLPSAELAVSHENRFMVKGLGSNAAVFAIPYNKHCFAIAVNNFGTENYNEYQVALAYAMRLSETLRTGLRFTYLGLKIPGYINQNAFSVAVGMQLNIHPKLRLGLYVQNLNKAKFDDHIESDLALLGVLGIAFRLSDKVIAVADLQKAVQYKTTFRAGLEYKFHRSFAARIGASSRPFKQYFGLGIIHKNFKLDLAVSSHPILGFSPQISLGYVF